MASWFAGGAQLLGALPAGRTENSWIKREGTGLSRAVLKQKNTTKPKRKEGPKIAEAPRCERQKREGSFITQMTLIVLWPHGKKLKKNRVKKLKTGFPL